MEETDSTPFVNTNTVTNTINTNTVKTNTVNTISTNTVYTNTVNNTVRNNTVSANTISTNTIRTNTVSNNTISNTFSNVISVPNGNANTNTIIYPGAENQKVDNYASTMSWSTLWTPGLETKVPSIWNVQVYKSFYSGEEDTGTVATNVNGWAIGINRDTNEVINSYVEIDYYMPEFVDCTSTEEFATIVANRNGKEFWGGGYGDAYNPGLTWAEINLYDHSTGEMNALFCHFEPLDDGTHGVGYIINVRTDNENNYKVTNILNWIFGDIRTTSF